MKKKQTENIYFPYHLFNKLEFDEIKMIAYIMHKNKYVMKCDSMKDFVDITINELTDYLQLNDDKVKLVTKKLIDKNIITIKEKSIAINWLGIIQLNDDDEDEEQDEISRLKAIIIQQQKEMNNLRQNQSVFYQNPKKNEYNDLPFD